MTLHRRPVRDRALLRSRLEELVTTFDLSTISPDPLEVVRRYERREDQEVVGVLAAAFAYGRADIVVRNVTWVTSRMGASPFECLRQLRKPDLERFSGFSHRFHKTADLVALLRRLSSVIGEHGSVGSLFQRCYDPRDPDIGPSLARFVAALIDSAPPSSALERKNLQYLLTSPTDGSACKRMNLFLRWMVRTESPDLGIWDFVDPSKLLMPLDTHVHRISTFLGLNQRKSADWKTARLLTDELRKLAPHDPVRYDFALCRLGILARCSRTKKKDNCDVCPLLDVCRFPVR